MLFLGGLYPYILHYYKNMRKYLVKHILDLLPTIWDGINFANENRQEAKETLLQCLTATNTICTVLKSGLSDQRFPFYEKLLNELKAKLELLFQSEEEQYVTETLNNIKNYLNMFDEELKNDSEVRLEVVFMPYNASMWDSLESIWIAAKNDPRCDVYVVPIPYYSINPDRSFGELRYEGNDLPDNVSVTNYNNYNLNIRQPDIIYIHNPYDNGNLVTSVHPKFYSFELKKHTDCLVYVPYYLYYSGNTNNILTISNTSVNKHADFIISQSEMCKESFERVINKSEKTLALGSPKVDKTINYTLIDDDIPKDWKDISLNRKVILLNLSIANLLEDRNYMNNLSLIIKEILNNDKLALILRPHPLLLSTIKSMRGNLEESYYELISMIENSANGVVDSSKDFYPAVFISDAMISDISSVAFLYFLTAKPLIFVSGIYNTKEKLFEYKNKDDRMPLLDIFAADFYPADISIKKFLEDVLEDRYDKKEQVDEAIRNSGIPTDGLNGMRINDYINNNVLDKFRQINQELN